MAGSTALMGPPSKMASTTWQSTSVAIPTACLAPPPIPPAKPWHRIAVPAANRRGKIWKRSGGLLTASVTSNYAAALTELHCQGQGSRKRARAAGFVPAWGVASWDEKIGETETHDGRCDLADARESVSKAKDAETTSDGIVASSTKSNVPTFAEEALRWVPRKRHNSRRPIEPCTQATGMVADLQPLTESIVPTAELASAEADDVAHTADAKQMRRRSTRRLSRRVSFAPVEDVLVQSSPIALVSPKKGLPMTRSPKRLSPMKLSRSPRKSFTMTATPSKIVLAAPLEASSPARSPARQPRLSPVHENMADHSMVSETDSSRSVLDPLPLLFDQPIPNLQVEPEHETRRRVSLQNARRSDRRRSSGARRLAAFEADQRPPSRRHSFLHTGSRLANAESRRHTLDVFGFGSGDIRLEVTSPPANEQPEPMVPVQEPRADSDAAVVVDVGTNLDIFGQSPGPSTPRFASFPAGGALTAYDSNMEVERESDTQLAAEISAVTGPVATSPIADALGLMNQTVTDEVTNDQAAATPPPPMTEVEMQHPVVDHPASPIEFTAPAEIPDSFCDPEQTDMFSPHDPEGLSTILEESFATDTINADLFTHNEGSTGGDNEHAAQPDQEQRFTSPSSPMPDPRSEQTALGPSTPENDGLSEDNFPECDDRDGSSTPTPATNLAAPVQSSSQGCAASGEDQPVAPTTDVSLAAGVQVIETADCDRLANSNSPSPNNTVEMSDGPSPEEVPSDVPDQSVGSPTPSDESIVTPDNDFCGTIALDVDLDDQDTDMRLDMTDLAHATPEKESLETDETLPDTPPRDTIAETDVTDGEAETVTETPPAPNTEFTPINDRRASPLDPAPELGSNDADSIALEVDDLEDTQTDGIVTAMDYEPTVPIEDPTTNIAGNMILPDNDPVTLQEDSETEMLRKFVTRVKADKSAKAAAAAALARRNLRPKRRSGSTGSTASTTGSPIAKPQSPSKRVPLGDKDLNSPSPTKKRKGRVGKDDYFKGKATLFSEESSPLPKSKRRRKRLDAELETTLDQSMSLVEPDADAADSGLRRSTRSRSTRVQLKPPAPSANSVALSMIPVRLPGSSGMMSDLDRDMPAIVIPKSRSEEKDLAAVTRVNTRKNKAGSVPPRAVLARQAEDPAAWRMRELKGVFDAREGREAEAAAGDADAAAGTSGTSSSSSRRRVRIAKGVRWAEELARFQGDGGDCPAPPAPNKPMAACITNCETAAVATCGPVGEPDEQGAPPAAAAAAAPEEAAREPEQQPEPQVEQQPEQPPAKKPPPKRTRTSRLQMPTPIRNKGVAGPKAVEKLPPVQQPAKRSAPSSSAASSSSSSSSSVVRMATRRSKIASLGMSANGTPAPKRRTRTVG
ncbi:hypothetical protein QBC33DRAFT_605059 [Phialemonium atrogriseum]|uniref:Uncharacterized protein n=1 Tax=Phialemonium atrogriseum TaxID=1093897 RepID=A0AAJ0FI13_9PEZI|nr:uncharacterized protein QBC33DRAFT_605059 [Phialemonium atrogriseum]KAK1761655.1 hypothetical protein QBC33DRAFT_605059 [Phialemonium atrogriseum]